MTSVIQDNQIDWKPENMYDVSVLVTVRVKMRVFAKNGTRARRIANKAILDGIDAGARISEVVRVGKIKASDVKKVKSPCP